jgi:hypothetical protein
MYDRLDTSIRGGYRTFANRSGMVAAEAVPKFLKSYILAIKLVVAKSGRMLIGHATRGCQNHQSSFGALKM